MANSWFRLWTDMVNDPKWRTIARVSKQKIGDVIAVYLHMMTMAANANERGRTEGFNDEDVATALDIDTEQVTAIRDAMQGRVLDGDILTGWEKRQPLREDGAAERGKAFRDRKKAEKERTQTQPNANERQIREEEIREEKKEPKVKTNVASAPVDYADIGLPAPTSERRKEPRASQDVQDVFAYWQQVMDHPHAKLDDKRSRAIGKRLSDGYTVGDLCQAVDGCRRSPHHMGQNEQRTVYDDIELICRDGTHVDKFIKAANATGIADPGLRRQIDVLQEWMETP